MSEASQNVKVYIYDLSKGMARAMSQAFLGKQINGIWHTGIVVYGKEFYFGGTGGIECCPPGGTILGQPDTIHSVGETQIPYDMFLDYLKDLAQSSYRPDSYHLLEHNCNTFSSDVAQFLTGNDIPGHITGLPQEVMATPFGQMIKPFIDSMSVQPSGGNALFPTDVSHVQPAQQTSQAQKIPSSQPTAQHSTKRPAKNDTTDFKPVIFEMDSSEKLKSDEIGLSSVEKALIKEIYEYIRSTDNNWSPGRDHLNLLIRLAFDIQAGVPDAALNVLGQFVLKEDIVHAFQHDPQSSFPKLIEEFEACSSNTKSGILKVFSNCCSSLEGCKLCISEKVQKTFSAMCVSGLLDEDAQISKCSAALCYNLILRKVKMSDDTELELGSALLTCCSKDLERQTKFHVSACTCAIAKRNMEIKGLAEVLGVDLDKLQESLNEQTKTQP